MSGGNRKGHNELPLKQLKIVKKTQSKKSNSNLNAGNKKRTGTFKMLEEPNYRFEKIYDQQEDSVFPFFHSKVVTASIGDRHNDKIDYTEDITFYKNITKKYTKPFKKRYIVQIPYQLSYKGNIFNPVKIDPILECFTHGKNDNKLRFGDYVIESAPSGAITTVYEPVVNTVSEEDIDESLYFTDEAEISRLDNSESEEELDDSDGDEDENEDSNFIDAFSSFLDSSPTKKSPMKKDMLFRSLQRNSSPIRNLKNERIGINQNVGTCVKIKSLGSVYATYDNSMTISAKGIMKMVDESLVSSDTEIYNHSMSFMKKERTAFNTKLVINADDLINALDDEFEKPLNL